MNEILERLFREHGFEKRWDENDGIVFYANTDINKASYYIVNYLDCTSNENDDFNAKLNSLQERYYDFSNHDNSIQKKICDSLEDTDRIAELDKNISAIYVMKLANFSNYEYYRNTVYAIEESAIYFKRYVLPYTDLQLEDLKQELNTSTKPTIEAALCELVNNIDGYRKLQKGIERENYYELVIRLFSKIPFLMYVEDNGEQGNDNGEQGNDNQESLEEILNRNLESDYNECDQLLSQGKEDFNEYLQLDERDIPEEFVTAQLDKILGGLNNEL